MFRFIINPKYVALFKYIDEKTSPEMRGISKHTKIHYIHLLTIMKQFQNEGLIKPIFDVEEAQHKKKPGNPYVIELTLKGHATKTLLNLFYDLDKGLGVAKIFKLLGIKEEKNEE